MFRCGHEAVYFGDQIHKAMVAAYNNAKKELAITGGGQ